MAIWKTITSEGIEVKFLAVRNGNLVSGISSGSFSITVVNPLDTDSISVSVSPSTQLAGMYKFTIPSSFFVGTSPVGHYGIRIGIHKPAPAPVDDEILQTLEVTEADIDMLANDINAIYVNLLALAAATIMADLTAQTGSTTTVVRTNATQADGFYDGLQVVVINSSGAVARKIDGYSQTNGAITLSPALPFTPSSGDNVIILGRIAGAAAAVDNNAIAIAVWARSKLSPSSGSYGELVNQIGDNAVLIPALV